MEQLEKRLQSFPQREEDTFERLEIIARKYEQEKELTPSEKMRLDYELSVIGKMGVASVFLFFYDTVCALKNVGITAHGVIHASFLCYLLGITKVNPIEYNLPFERYFGTNRKYLPFVSFAVKKGGTGRLIQYLKKRYGIDKIARVVDMPHEYILSDENILQWGTIAETFLHTDGFLWHEDVSSLTSRDVARLGLYTFGVRETKIKKYRHFTDEEIYQKALDWWRERDFSVGERYRETEEEVVKEIFAKTHGRYLYQEQFFEICTQILGVSNKKADEFRKALLLRRKMQIEEIKELFMWRMGEEGLALFEYIKSRHRYVVAKAYIIGLLFLDFGEE